MMIALHKQARTTPLIRAEIAASDEPVSALMQRYGVTAATVRKWRHRTAFHDRSHTAQRLQTTLSPAQEAIVVYLGTTLLLPLDDLLAVTREFLCPQGAVSDVGTHIEAIGATIAPTTFFGSEDQIIPPGKMARLRALLTHAQ